MKKSLERLYHFNCGLCEKWWSIGDAPEGALWYCPWCGIPQIDGDADTGEVDTERLHYSGKGMFFHVHSGKKFFPFECTADDIEITDIAHALGNVCRYGGHGEFYSVAEHSVIVSRLVSEEFAFQALMHDASEAYVGDLIRPLKHNIPAFGLFEDHIFKRIAEKYNFDSEVPEEVKHADNLVLYPETLRVFGGRVDPIKAGWYLSAGIPDFEIPIQLLSPAEAKAAFLSRFDELT